MYYPALFYLLLLPFADVYLHVNGRVFMKSHNILSSCWLQFTYAKRHNLHACGGRNISVLQAPYCPYISRADICRLIHFLSSHCISFFRWTRLYSAIFELTYHTITFLSWLYSSLATFCFR